MDSFDITKINFENLRRKFAFQSGVNFVSAPEHDQKNQLKPFDRIPDVLPIKFRAEQSISEEIKEASKLLPSDGDLE
jgi:hypothetical protein